MSKVYIKVDSEHRIIGCDGGYTICNIEQEIDRWIEVDEGEGDRYNLCQSHYLEDGVRNFYGVCLYKYVDGEIVHRTQAEIDADMPSPIPAPTLEERVDTLEENVEDLINGRTE